MRDVYYCIRRPDPMRLGMLHSDLVIVCSLGRPMQLVYREMRVRVNTSTLLAYLISVLVNRALDLVNKAGLAILFRVVGIVGTVDRAVGARDVLPVSDDAAVFVGYGVLVAGSQVGVACGGLVAKIGIELSLRNVRDTVGRLGAALCTVGARESAVVRIHTTGRMSDLSAAAASETRVSSTSAMSEASVTSTRAGALLAVAVVASKSLLDFLGYWEVNTGNATVGCNGDCIFRLVLPVGVSLNLARLSAWSPGACSMDRLGAVCCCRGIGVVEVGSHGESLCACVIRCGVVWTSGLASPC